MLQFKRATRILLTAAMLCGLTLLRPPGALAQTLPPALNNALVREDLASPDAIVEQMLPRYLEGRSARFIDWLGDGSMLVATRFGETEQIHRVRAALAAAICSVALAGFSAPAPAEAPAATLHAATNTCGSRRGEDSREAAAHVG